MSMKFERCMDSEVIKFLLLADDYTKVAVFICRCLLYTVLQKTATLFFGHNFSK